MDEDSQPLSEHVQPSAATTSSSVKRPCVPGLASDDRTLYVSHLQHQLQLISLFFDSYSEDSVGRGKNARFETSLAYLTAKFVQMVKARNGGLLDLNDAAIELGVAKRRVYDITNVLEGVFDSYVPSSMFHY